MHCLRSLAQALPQIPVPRASLATSAFLTFSKVIRVQDCVIKRLFTGSAAMFCSRQKFRSEEKWFQGRLHMEVATIYWVASGWRNCVSSSTINSDIQAVWPNYTQHYTHHKHRRQQTWHTYGVQKQTLMNVVDNSNLGRQAMAEGRPPKVSHWADVFVPLVQARGSSYVLTAFLSSGHPCLR